MRTLFLLAMLLLSPLAHAQASDPTPLLFRDTAQETRFHRLTAELRCVMCQNQSLADSNALIARDLRREVLDLMHAGKSDEEIKQFLVARYTDFVLYQPRVGPSTWLLWFGPGLLLAIGVATVVVIVRKHGRGAPPTAPESDSQEW